MPRKQFPILYREFLFRMIDRELLASQAQGDANRLLGRFTAILIWISLPFAGMAFGGGNGPRQLILERAWGPEHAIIATTMLIVSLFAVLSWDGMFPERRDVLVLSPLPVRPATLFAAKAVSLAAALGLTVAVFNGLPGIATPLALTPPGWNFVDMALSIHLYRGFAAYWFTVLAAGAFILASVLCIQGIAAQLPRGIFLRLSSGLQIGTFCLAMGVYFLEPTLTTPAALTNPDHQTALHWLPSYWSLGLFQQLNGGIGGSAAPTLRMLAARAWIALAISAAGGCGAFLLAYYRTLRKIVEQPDIAPASRRVLRLPRFGGQGPTAIAHFSIRTLLRSHHHRVILAFYAGMGFAILILFLKTPFARQISAISGVDPWRQASVPVIASTFVMLVFWTLGVRVAMAIPMELKAHWVFRILPLPGPAGLLPATRRTMYALALAPLWTGFALCLSYLWPPRVAFGHLAVYALVNAVLIELCLRGFRKVPFTCSFLPGKSNLHITVCLCLLLGMNILYLGSEAERRALADAGRYTATAAMLAAATLGARRMAERAAEAETELLFEEEPAPAVTSLGLYRDGYLPAQTPAGE